MAASNPVHVPHDGAVGLCSIAGLELPFARVVEAARAAGLDGLEVTARAPHLDPEDAASVAGARRVLDAAGLPAIGYGSYLGFREPWSAAACRDAVAVAVELGAPYLRVWADEALVEHVQDRLVDGLRCVGDVAHRAGCQVVVERHVRSFADSAERVEQLLAAVDHGAVWLNYQPLDELPVAAVSEAVVDADRLGGISRYAHLKNYRLPEVAGDRARDGVARLELGGDLATGVLDVTAILAAARHAGFVGPAMVEFLATDDRAFEVRVADAARSVRSR